jgi:signal transduction histidine kinase
MKSMLMTERLARLSVRKWLAMAIVPITLLGALAIGLATAMLSTQEVALYHVNAGTQMTTTLAQHSDLALLYESSAGIAETAASLLDNPLVRQIRVIDRHDKILFEKTVGEAHAWTYPPAPEEGVASAELSDFWVFACQVRTSRPAANDPWLPEAALLGNGSNEVLGKVQLVLSKDALFKARRSIFFGNVVTSFAFSLLAMFAILAIVRNFSRPLEALADTMHETRAGAWAEPEVPVGPREIREIGESYNSMMAVLRQREEQLRDFNQDLEERIRERTQALEAANKELEAFSYSASHDLRAPLRAIDGFGKALLEDFAPSLDPTAQSYLQRMCEAARRMSDLIDNLLKLSRVTRYEMQVGTINMSEMAAAVVAQLREQNPQRNVDFRASPGMHVSADPNLLRIALDNLIGNAWKYTGRVARPEVVFEKLKQGQETVYLLRDNGAGFDMRFADKLFGAFQRLHGKEFEGTGIGLAIVTRVLLRHGGRIWAEAEVDKGARFYFTLPDA